MATKRPSAYNMALNEAQQQLHHEVIAESGTEIEQVSPVVVVPSAKGGRPRNSVTKSKKTLYLAGGVERIKNIQLDIAKRADLLIKDESDIVDLALILLESMMRDQAGFNQALDTYEKYVR